jgi:P63C domain
MFPMKAIITVELFGVSCMASIDASKSKKSPSLLGPSKGGVARAQKMTAEQRKEIAQKAAEARWGKAQGDQDYLELEAVDGQDLPEAKFKGTLPLMDIEIPCYVLETGQRVIGRTAMTEMLTGIKGGGGLEKYIGVAPLKPFINRENVLEKMVAFRLPEVEGLERHVKGLPADLVIEVCQGFVRALEAGMKHDSRFALLTARQTEMAVKASMFLSACAKVGLDALIDEATGYQYERASDALQVKLKAYIAEDMRKWEKTFPNELWLEFGRLTNWHGTVTHRPKYWGKLVIELVYEYLDADVARWLKENAPKPRHRQNYHQWLTAQYGLRKLLEHIWKLIGVASTCRNLPELKQKMAEMHGLMPVQYTLYLPIPEPKEKEKTQAKI